MINFAARSEKTIQKLEEQGYHDFCQAICNGDRKKIDSLITEISCACFIKRVSTSLGEKTPLELAIMKNDEKSVRLIVSKMFHLFDNSILHLPSYLSGERYEETGSFNAIIISEVYKQAFINNRLSCFNEFHRGLQLEHLFDNISHKCIHWVFKQGEVLEATRLKVGIDLFHLEVLNEVTRAVSTCIKIPPLVSIIFGYYFDVSIQDDYLNCAERISLFDPGHFLVSKYFNDLLEVFRITKLFHSRVEEKLGICLV